MLSHLLHRYGIASVVIDTRSREAIKTTIRAGVLEQGTADLMTQTGIGECMHREGFVHHGFELRFAGQGHRIDVHGLAGRIITPYAQHEVLRDLIRARLMDGGGLRFGVSQTNLNNVTGDHPQIRFVDSDGVAREIDCDYIAGCDGFSASVAKRSPKPSARNTCGSIRSDGSASCARPRHHLTN